jgi:methyl coenzyme M reductase beta subunit
MLLAINTQGEEGKDGGGGGMNPVMKRHLELEIKTLQNAPRGADKLERLLTVKERQKEEAMHMEDTQKLVTEIEMLRIVVVSGEHEQEYNTTTPGQKNEKKFLKD